MPAYSVHIDSSFRSHDVTTVEPGLTLTTEFKAEKDAITFARMWSKAHFNCSIEQTSYRNIK